MKKIYALLAIPLVVTCFSQAATKTIKHKIKSGETLYTIAHANHTTIEEVRKANGLKKGDVLKVGRTLTVPQRYIFPEQKKRKKEVCC